MYQKIAGKTTVAEIVSLYGNDARGRLEPYFNKAGITYPPRKIMLLGIKKTHALEVWAETDSGPQYIRTYDIQALSGSLGPKLREGDKQVPEGLYEIEGLNPNSSYHLSMKINYPNAYDIKYASIEGRDKPGTNIFIHGKAVSIGCLAMGDTTIEELFVMAADVGVSNVHIAIAPTDPRVLPLSVNVKPDWVAIMYEKLNSHFQKYLRYKS